MPFRIKLGDIIEIPTSKGLAYAQYTHRAKGEGGYVIRVLDGLYENRPQNFNELAKNKHRFVTIFPLGAAVHRKIFAIVGHTEIPKEAQQFPLFRAAGFREKDGKVVNWWLWDGENSWRVEKLTLEQYKLPIKSIPNDIALVEMIEEGWTPEKDWWMAVPKEPN